MGRPENHRASDKKYAGEIFSGLPLKIQLTLSEVSRWIPQLKKLKNDLWRPLIVGVLACHMAACQPTRGFEDQTPPSTTPIVEPYHPQPTPELVPTSPLELTPTPEPTPIATPGPTISGETLTISDSQLELKEFDGEEIAQLINASEKGWQVITNDKGKISFFSGYAGEAGKESQVVVLAQGPENYQWNPDNQLWQKDNQVVIPDILLPGGWNEEKQMAGPAYEADIVFLFKDESGNYRIGVVYNPEKVAQISDKSNLVRLPDGSGLYVGSPKNYELQEGQQIIRDEDGNLRLTNADGSYLLMRTSWSQVTSPNQLYQAGTFAGPFETQPALPYPTDEIVQELGITNYQVVDNHYIALQEVVDQQTGKTHQHIVAQAITNKEGEFTGWQRTLPFYVESGLVVPHPQETNPELFDTTNPYSPIVQFANAFGVKPEEVTANLHAEMETPEGLPAFAVLRTSDGVALTMAQKDENGNWVWKRATPGRYWGALGKHIGVTMNGPSWKFPNNKTLTLSNFSDGGILGLLGQVRPGPDIDERRPSNASEYLRAAKMANMAFMFNYVVEPGKFPKGITAENVDQWLKRRLSEIADVILQNKPNQPVYIQFNEATYEGRWNSDYNPLRNKYGEQWVGEYLYQNLSIFINKGLIPNKDFVPLFNENGMFGISNQVFLHKILTKARINAYQKLVSDPVMAKKLKGMGINSAEDIKVMLGSQTYVNLDGRANNGVDFIPNPSLDQINKLADFFSDLGGIFFTEVAPMGTNEQKAEFLNKMVIALKNNPNIKGLLLWNALNNPPDPKDIYAQSPTRLFNFNGTPTQLYFELLRETPSN